MEDLVIDAAGVSETPKLALEIVAPSRPNHQGGLGPAAAELLIGSISPESRNLAG
jgi:hypothetical protein